jgi:hypothetical protein
VVLQLTPECHGRGCQPCWFGVTPTVDAMKK